jgi:hypothetical protein
LTPPGRELYFSHNPYSLRICDLPVTKQEEEEVAEDWVNTGTSEIQNFKHCFVFAFFFFALGCFFQT